MTEPGTMDGDGAAARRRVKSAQQQRRREARRICANCSRDPIEMYALRSQHVPLCGHCIAAMEAAKAPENRDWWRHFLPKEELARVLGEREDLPADVLLFHVETLVSAHEELLRSKWC